MSLNVVGISAYFHESACAVIRDGKLVAAASEERFSRHKYDPAIPLRAFQYCLRESGLTIDAIDAVAYYEDPRQKLQRQLWMMFPGLPSKGSQLRRMDPSVPEREIREVLGCECPLRIVEHHQAHAASSFYFSGFPDAAILTADGVGEWATTTYGRGSASGLEVFEAVHFPHSLGLFYSTLTSYLGFGVNDGEYKVMGLAPYGRPRYVDRLRQAIEVMPGGQFRLDTQYFDFQSSERMYSDAMIALLGEPPRQPREPIAAFHEDLARSAQTVLEEVLLEKVFYLHDQVHTDALCMAGGVALNCVANSAVLNRGPFRRLFVQPAAGDAGGAVGAAVIAHRALEGGASASASDGPAGRDAERLEHVYLGPAYTAAEIARLIEASGLDAIDCRASEDELIGAAVDRLAEGDVIGWFQGRMEFGPRALGARSILADPRDPSMRDRINGLVKKREAFRPFAPAVLLSRAREHFDLAHASPFMLETCQVTSPLALPAITHVDGSARVQTVTPETNPRFARLLEAFERRTGCPILLNTSFNMKDEPIVCSPTDALICFWRSGIDSLVLGDFVLDRSSCARAQARRELVTAAAPLDGSAINHHTYTLV